MRKDISANIVSFQGTPGAFSHLACLENFPDARALACESFEEAFTAVREQRADLAMIPVDNSVAGRVADVHHLMPHCGLHIVAEAFLRVNHHLLAVPGTPLQRIRDVFSHVHALGQCRSFLHAHSLRGHVAADTAGAAAEVAEAGDISKAAIASQLAAEIYGLEVLCSNIEDAEHNTTRFVILSPEPHYPERAVPGEVITSFLFRVRNVPAALYKALGGFATNGVNMLKLESYIDPTFQQAQFFAEVRGHIESEAVRLALEELRFFAHSVEILGVYPASLTRSMLGQPPGAAD